MSDLTEREAQVLLALAEGLTNKEIGQRLRISDLTVRDHISQMLRKTGTRNRVELAMQGRMESYVGTEIAGDRPSTAPPTSVG